MSNDQDWTPVVFRKTIKPKVITATGPASVIAGMQKTSYASSLTMHTSTKQNAAKNSSGVNQSTLNMRKLENDEIEKIPTVTSDLKKTIVNARVKLGLNQDQFAQKCNLPKSVIQSYESGKALVTNNQHLQKMSRVLGVPLRNK